MPLQVFPIRQGQNTDVDSGAAEALTTTTTIQYGVVLKALPANTGTLFVRTDGTTATTANGFPLAAGDAQAFDVAVVLNGDLANISVIASADNQGVAWSGV